MSSLVGIDFSTHAIDLVAIDEDTGTPTWTRCDLSGSDAFERTRSVAAAMPQASFWSDCLAIGIEEPQGAQRATVAKLKAIQGAVLSCIPRSIVVQPFQPAEWRRAVGLPGNASKGHVRVYAIAKRTVYITEGTRTYYLEPEVWPQDAQDAYLIARALEGRVEAVA